MKTTVKLFTALMLFSTLTPVLAQDAAAPAAAPAAGRRGGGRGAGQTEWYLNKPPGGPSAYKAPNQPIWRLADLLEAHAGQNNWSQLIVRDNESDATYNSAAPGTTITPRMHPDTPTAFIVVRGQMRFTVVGHDPVIAKRGSIIHILKTDVYSYEVLPGENALWLEYNVLGYTTLYPATGEKPPALPGAPVVKVVFPKPNVSYEPGNVLAFNTLDGIAACNTNDYSFTDQHMYMHLILGYANPADNKCPGGRGGRGGGEGDDVAPGGGRGGRGGVAPAAYDSSVPFGHLHSGAVEWWLVQVGGIDAKFENYPEMHAVEGDVIYAAPMTWHQMGDEGPGPSVRLAFGGYQRINMNNTGPAAP